MPTEWGQADGQVNVVVEMSLSGVAPNTQGFGTAVLSLAAETPVFVGSAYLAGGGPPFH